MNSAVRQEWLGVRHGGIVAGRSHGATKLGGWGRSRVVGAMCTFFFLHAVPREMPGYAPSTGFPRLW